MIIFVVCIIAQTGIENAPSPCTYKLLFRQVLVQKSVLWSEDPDIECSLMSGCGQGYEPTENVSIKL